MSIDFLKFLKMSYYFIIIIKQKKWSKLDSKSILSLSQKKKKKINIQINYNNYGALI